MASYTVVCTKCKKVDKRISTKKDFDKLRCRECNEKVNRDYKASNTSSKVMEVLDNGVMPKKVERLRDAETLFKERGDNSDPLSGT